VSTRDFPADLKRDFALFVMFPRFCLLLNRRLGVFLGRQGLSFLEGGAEQPPPGASSTHSKEQKKEKWVSF